MSTAWQPEMDHLRHAAKRWRDAFHDLNSAPEPDPEPVPEWREWVTAQHDEVVGSRASALEDVLMCLSEVERGTSKNYALARIVARCEREVGDGWQADPSGWVATPALHALLRCVAGVPTGPGTAWPETDWQGLANAASAWLRDLTDGATTPGCPACPEHGHTLDDHCTVCFGSCGGFPEPVPEWPSRQTIRALDGEQ
jgi:hypothetical protein